MNSVSKSVLSKINVQGILFVFLLVPVLSATAQEKKTPPVMFKSWI